MVGVLIADTHLMAAGSTGFPGVLVEQGIHAVDQFGSFVVERDIEIADVVPVDCMGVVEVEYEIAGLVADGCRRVVGRGTGQNIGFAVVEPVGYIEAVEGDMEAEHSSIGAEAGEVDIQAGHIGCKCPVEVVVVGVEQNIRSDCIDHFHVVHVWAAEGRLVEVVAGVKQNIRSDCIDHVHVVRVWAADGRLEDLV